MSFLYNQFLPPPRFGCTGKAVPYRHRRIWSDFPLLLSLKPIIFIFLPPATSHWGKRGAEPRPPRFEKEHPPVSPSPHAPPSFPLSLLTPSRARFISPRRKRLPVFLSSAFLMQVALLIVRVSSPTPPPRSFSVRPCTPSPFSSPSNLLIHNAKCRQVPPLFPIPLPLFSPPSMQSTQKRKKGGKSFSSLFLPPPSSAKGDVRCAVSFKGV